MRATAPFLSSNACSAATSRPFVPGKFAAPVRDPPLLPVASVPPKAIHVFPASPLRPSPETGVQETAATETDGPANGPPTLYPPSAASAAETQRPLPFPAAPPPPRSQSCGSCRTSHCFKVVGVLNLDLELVVFDRRTWPHRKDESAFD